MSHLAPRQIIDQLDHYVIGLANAKSCATLQNIGVRRLMTIDERFVRGQIKMIVEDKDLSRFVL